MPHTSRTHTPSTGVTCCGSHLLVSAGYEGQVEVIAVCLHQEQDLGALDYHNLLMQRRVPWFTVPEEDLTAALRRISPHPDTLNLHTLRIWAMREALKLTNGNRTHAAPLLGIKGAALRTYLLTYPEIEEGVTYDQPRHGQVDAAATDTQGNNHLSARLDA